jgi:hypothetical protein
VAKQCSSNGSYIHGEVWDITPESLSLIRGIELGAGYKEGIIITEHDYPAFYFYGEEGSFQSFTHLGSVFEVNK